MQRLVVDLRALSADDMEGRGTGTAGGLKARAYVVRRMAENGVEPLVPGYLQRFTFDHTSLSAVVRRHRPVRVRVDDAANVVGVVRGRDPSASWIVVSAHYDHLGRRDGTVYPGADDNASGVAAVLEIARWLRRNPPRRTVVVAAFDAEEMGLRGARTFVASGLVPRERVGVAVNLDMVGRGTGNVLVAAGSSHTPAFAPLLHGAAKHASVQLRLGHDQPAWRGTGDDWTEDSDHAAFHEAGIPFLYFGVEDHADYHRPTDTANKVDPAFLHGATEVVLDTLLALDGRATLP